MKLENVGFKCHSDDMYIIAMIHRNVLENRIDSLHYLSWGKIKRLNSVEIICTHFSSLEVAMQCWHLGG